MWKDGLRKDFLFDTFVRKFTLSEQKSLKEAFFR